MRRARGFSLIEVAAALAVVACLFVALASLEIVTHKAARSMHTLVLARQVCDDQLALARKDIQRVPASREGVAVSDGTEFRWVLVVTDVPVGTMKDALVRLEITCRWSDEAGPRTLVQRAMMALPEVVNPPPSPSPSPMPSGAPASDASPDADRAPGIDAAPDADRAPGIDAAPTADGTPGSDAAPTADGTPGSDAAPTAEGTPGSDAAPSSDGSGVAP